MDRHLAVTARHNRLPALNPVLHEARLRCNPDQAAAVEQNALDHRGVWLDHQESTATTTVTARMDTLDALDLDGSVGDLASLLGRLGDDRDLDVRRASALGMLAHPQRALDLAAGPDPDTDPEASKPTSLNGCRGTLYLHVTLADLASTTGGGRVERLGTASLAVLRDWLQRLSAVSIRPGPRPGPHRHGRRPRPTRLDAGPGDPPRPALRVPRLPGRREVLRPRPPRPLRAPRRGWSSRPDHPAEPRVPVSPASPGQDLRRLALPPPPRPGRPARSDVRVDQSPPPPHLPRPPRRLRRAITLVEVRHHAG